MNILNIDKEAIFIPRELHALFFPVRKHKQSANFSPLVKTFDFPKSLQN